MESHPVCYTVGLFQQAYGETREAAAARLGLLVAFGSPRGVVVGHMNHYHGSRSHAAVDRSLCVSHQLAEIGARSDSDRCLYDHHCQHSSLASSESWKLADVAVLGECHGFCAAFVDNSRFPFVDFHLLFCQPHSRDSEKRRRVPKMIVRAYRFRLCVKMERTARE